MTVPDTERLELQAEPASVGQARSFVRRVLTDWGFDEVIDTVTLLTSELATNAVLHARTGFAVHVTQLVDFVRVDVLDQSPAPPRRLHNTLTATTGRGVAMVERLSTQWGETDPTDLGRYAKGVWFMVPMQGESLSTWDDWAVEG